MGKYGFSVYLGGISDRVRTGDVEDFLKGNLAVMFYI